jgi:hypothetical protein
VERWVALHTEDLEQAWRRAVNNEPPGSIEPLKD